MVFDRNVRASELRPGDQFDLIVVGRMTTVKVATVDQFKAPHLEQIHTQLDHPEMGRIAHAFPANEVIPLVKPGEDWACSPPAFDWFDTLPEEQEEDNDNG